MNTWSESVRKLLGLQLPRNSRRAATKWRRRLELTPLEDRTVPATITVTSLSDNLTVDTKVTLREAIQAAETDTAVDGSTAGSGADIIVFDSKLSGSIDLLLTDANTTFGPTGLVITTDVTIDGLANFDQTKNNTITINRGGAAGDIRLFAVDAGGALTLQGVTLTGGKAVGGAGGGGDSRGGGGGGAGLGGAVFVDAAGSLDVVQSLITGNSAVGGKGGTGGAAYGGAFAGGAGGGGLGGSGSNATGFYFPYYGLTLNAYGGAGGGPNAGAGGTVALLGDPTGQDGGFGGGGGGGGSSYYSYYYPYYYPGGNGGNGGFGGGGGSRGYSVAGAFLPGTSMGGFGGGGGFVGNYVGGGLGGFGGGSSNNTNSSGGGGAGMGGAIFSNGGPVTITNSTITGNTATGGDGGAGAANAGQGLGGGVFNRNGALTILNSTISGNTAKGARDVYNLSDGAGEQASATINNTIIGQTNNTTADFANQINAGGTAPANAGVGNLIRNNTPVATGATGFSGTFTLGDPDLSGLVSKGGPTQVLFPNTGSPAIDLGNNAAAAALTTDQRGAPFVRTFGAAVDIGAVEVQGATITSVTSTTADGTYGLGAVINVTVNFSAPVTLAGGNLTVTLNTGGIVTITPFTNQTTVSGTYTVAAGQSTPDLNSNSPLTLAGGATLVNSDGQGTTLTIPAGQSLGDLKAIVIDTTGPTTTISGPSAAITATGPITYTVTYTDTNFGASTLTAADVTLNTTGTATGTVSVTGSGNTRTVTISNITGDGTIGISIPAGTATDAVGNPSTAGGPSPTFEADNTAPTISISAPSATSASAGPITYTVTYADKNFASSSLTAANVTLNTTGTATGTISVSGNGLTRTVTISNITGDGSLGISIAAGTATDTAGNQAPAAGPSDTFTVRNSSLFAVGGADGTVRVVNAKNGQTLTSFRPLDIPGVVRYTGLVQVAIGDLNGDGVPDVFVSAANPLKTDGLSLTKAARVFVYDGATLAKGTIPAPFRTFTPFKNHFGPGRNGSVDQSGDYVNGVNIAVADVNGDGTLDLIAGTRGGVLANGAPEYGRLVVIDGSSAPGNETTIGAIVTPFGLGYQKGVVVAAGDINGDGKAEIAVTRGGPVAAVNPNKDLAVKVFQFAGGSLNELALTGVPGTPLTPFTGITGPDGKVLARDARVAFVDTDGDGNDELVVTILDPYSIPGNTQVRIAAFAINPTSGLASPISNGSGPSNSFTVGNNIVDHAITHINPLLGLTTNLALITESATSGIQYLNPITGASVPGGFGLSVVNGGIAIDGF